MDKANISAYITNDGEIIEVSQKNKKVIVIDTEDHIITKKQIEHLAESKRRRGYTADFIWVRFKYNRPLYPTLKPNIIARMFCLATHTSIEGLTATKQNIKPILNSLSDGLITELVDTLDKQGIITPVKGGKFKVNRNHFYRGTMDSSTDNHIRLFSGAIRALYNSLTPTKHRYMAYILQMIPYLNRPTNILCRNQSEQSLAHIEYMTFKDFCSIIGLNVTHASRIKTQLLKLRIYDELAVGFFNNTQTMKLTPKGKYVIVNPRLFFGGEPKTESHLSVMSLFEETKFDNK